MAGITDLVKSTVNGLQADADQWGQKAAAIAAKSLEDGNLGDLSISPITPPEGIDIALDPFEGKLTLNVTQPKFDSPKLTTGSFSLEYKEPGPEAKEDTSYFSLGVSAPGAKPELDYGEVPDVIVPDIGEIPVFDKPIAPVLGTLTIPKFTGLVLPSMEISLPIQNLPTLSNRFNYTDRPYSREVLDEILTEVRAVINGRMAVPMWVWEAQWSRVAGDLARQAVAQKREARRAQAKLGWSLPGGVMLAGQAAAEQNINEQMAIKAVEMGVQQSLQTREDFWQAMQHGIAIEQMLIQADAQRQERLLKAAIEANNAGIAVYNAAVAGYNTLMQAAAIEAQLKELELKGALAKLDVYRAELEGVKIESEVDKNKVALYTAQWDGVKAQAQAYAAWVDSIRAYVEAQKASVEAYGEKVKANNTIMQGWAIEWEAYTKKLEGPRLRIADYEAKTGRFAARVQSYQAQIQNAQYEFNEGLEEYKLKLQNDQNQVAQYAASVQRLNSAYDAQTKAYQTEGQVYGIQAEAKMSLVDALIKKYQADVQRAQIEQGLKVDQARNALGLFQAEIGAQVQWQSAQASVYAQLGSAAYSAANISLGASSGYSDSRSEQESVSTSYNYSGTVK